MRPSPTAIMHRIAPTIAFAAAFLVALEADAHINLVEPSSRYNRSVQKSPPCGQGDGARSDDVATYRAGETIPVVWNEYIGHPGHFRIAFDRDGQDDFEPPNCTSNCDAGDPEFELNINDGVLLDGVESGTGGEHREHVTLPDVTCDNCTLQVIQVMYDKFPYEVPGNDIYYQCADLKLVGGGGGETDTGGGMSDAGDVPDTGETADTGGGGSRDTSTSPGDDTWKGTDDTGDPSSGDDANGAAGDDAAVEVDGVETERGCRAAGGDRPVPIALVFLSLFVATFYRRGGSRRARE